MNQRGWRLQGGATRLTIVKRSDLGKDEKSGVSPTLLALHLDRWLADPHSRETVLQMYESVGGGTMQPWQMSQQVLARYVKARLELAFQRGDLVARHEAFQVFPVGISIATNVLPATAPSVVPKGPPAGKDNPKKEVQKFKLVELIEVVHRPGLGTVVGAASAATSGVPKNTDRTDKDSANFKQFINLGKEIEGPNKKHPEYGRYVELRARIEWVSGDKSKSLANKKVHWLYEMTPHSSAKRPANLDGTQNPGFGSENGSKTLISDTDAAGWTPIVKFYLSQYGGDQFILSTQADEEEKGVPSGEKMKTGSYIVWRKFWYQMTYAKGKVIQPPDQSINAYKIDAASMLQADEVTYEKTDVANSDRTFYPEWMVAGGKDTSDSVVIGGHNRDWFYGKFNSEANRPVKGHLILADHQWDPAGTTGLTTIPMDARTMEAKFDLGAWNAGIVKPALEGDLVAYGKWKVSLSKFSEFFNSIGATLGIVDEIKREGDLTDTNIRVELGRSGLNTIKVVLPADCPDPKKYPVTVQLKLRYGKYYAGESNVHQMLIVYKTGKDKEFNQVVSHEFGHGFGQTPRPAKQPKGLPNHPKQYTNEHGGVGSHCSTGATLGAVANDAPSGRYAGGTCIMFHQINPTGCKQKFCDDCVPYLRLQNMDKLQ